MVDLSNNIANTCYDGSSIGKFWGYGFYYYVQKIMQRNKYVFLHIHDLIPLLHAQPTQAHVQLLQTPSAALPGWLARNEQYTFMRVLATLWCMVSF